MIDELKPYPEYKESGLPWLGMVPAHWVTHRTKSVISNVTEQTLRVAMPKVNWEALANFYLWFPPLEEQALILDFIASAAAPFDDLIKYTEREIALLREYRTTLTADIVTGKLDVRGTMMSRKEPNHD